LWPQVIFSGLDLNSKSLLQPVMQALYGFESARLTSTYLLKVLSFFLNELWLLPQQLAFVSEILLGPDGMSQ
jgi:hypothetical protein